MAEHDEIRVRLDRESERDNPRWIISRDTVGDDGETLASETIRSFPIDQETDAIDAAGDEAADLGLTLTIEPE